MKTTSKSLIALSAVCGLAFNNVQAAAILSREHTDIGIAYEAGAFDLHIHAEHLDAEFAPSEAVLRVLPSAQVAVPANPAFSFLGAVGEPVWVLPQDEQTAEEKGLLVLGLGAEEANPADFAGNLTVHLGSVNFTPEPGQSPAADFAVYTVNGSGVPTVLMSTHDGVDTGDAATVIPGTHFDPNWAFTQPGRYEITLNVAGNLAAGGVVNGSATYTFVVKGESSPGTPLAKGEIIEVAGNDAQVTALTPVVAARDSGGISVVTFKGYGPGAAAVNAANNTGLFALKNFSPALIARKGDAAPGLPVGLSLRSFTNIQAATINAVAFVSTVGGAVGAVTATNDSALFVSAAEDGAYQTTLVARKGDVVPGAPGYFWTAFNAVLVGEDGAVSFFGTARDPVAKITRSYIARKSPSAALEILAATGSTLTTDSGSRVVRSFSRPMNAGQKSGNADARIEVLVTFADGGIEIVRF